MRALDPNGVAELLGIARGTEAEHAIIVAIGTGLRRGELLGLRWSDLNLHTARLTVRRSVETVKGVTRTKPPKTTRSARTIALPRFALDALRNQRAESDKRRTFFGLPHSEDDWVFTRADESPWTPHVFSLTFARMVKRAGLKPVRLHDLRHTFGTLALASGVDLKTVSTALGHSTIAMTANTYMHAVESLQQDAADRIDTLLGGIVGKARSSVPRDPRPHQKPPSNQASSGRDDRT
jgi:integrase